MFNNGHAGLKNDVLLRGVEEIMNEESHLVIPIMECVLFFEWGWE